MKTTNFEISKKLAEIGFVHYTDFYHIADEKCKSRGEDPDDYELEYISSEESYKIKKHYNIPSYDLETLIKALPKTIQFKQKEYCFWMQWSGSSNCLLIGYVYGNLRAVELEVWQELDESLADTAGRLLIKLFEAGIINFKK